MTLGAPVAVAAVLDPGDATRFGYRPDGIGWLLAAAASLLPVAARLIQGEPLRVVAERVAMPGHTLRWLVSRIDQRRPYYLLGEVEMPDGRGPALTGWLDRVETYKGFV